MRSAKYIFLLMWCLPGATTTSAYTHADTLRGSNGPGRNWWDVQHYTLSVQFDTTTKSIAGSNTILFKITAKPHDSLQIDLQEPMLLDSVVYRNKQLPFAKEGNVWSVKYPFHTLAVGSMQTITCYYHGKPTTALHPPWDGGFIWTTDSMGKPWIAVACQGLGASVWWPCKDAQWDEPDKGQDMEFIVPGSVQCISNGKLLEKKALTNGRTSWHWQVKNPIDNYDVTFYIGDYIHWTDTLMGEKGALPLDFYALSYNEAKARKQFAIVKPMLHCFEYWMGPYPFYEDGYKLVEAPYLGMEHQSAVAYGNGYQMGYLGNDRSATGIGMTFDYIIVHESGHEWFGNSITAKDIADNWIHEGITTWSEALFVDCMLGREASGTYSRGNWSQIRNNRPLIGDYGVNNEGSNDIYRKGAAMMYMLRVLMNDDSKFRDMMRGLSDSFYHKTVNTTQVENYIQSYFTNMSLGPFFNQYLRTTDIPHLEYYMRDQLLFYHFKNVADGLTLPVEVNGYKSKFIYPTANWQQIPWNEKMSIPVEQDMLIQVDKQTQ